MRKFGGFLGAFGVLILGFSSKALASPDPLYVGSESSEATLRFEARLVLVTEEPVRPSMALVEKRVDAQLAYLIGPMRIRRTASVYGGHQVEVLSVELQPGKHRTWDVSYRYAGRIILADSEQGPAYTVFLPLQPSKVFARAIVDGKQTCTDNQHPSESLFFYSWLPDSPGCSLQEGVDYQKIAASFERKKNTELTFPEYDRLKGDDGVVRISVFHSKSEHGTSIPDPVVSDDSGARDYVDFRKRMIREGYQVRPWAREEIRGVARGGELPVIETFKKVLAQGTIEVTAFFGETDLNDGAEAFHHFWKRALERDSVILYMGHSGVGKNLHLPKIETERGFKIRLPTDQYQLMLFGSCVSYSYYPRMYFGRKATAQDPEGSRQLDIVVNGTESYFGSNDVSSFLILEAVELAYAGTKRTSYQEIAARGTPDYLFGITGDEDNPRQ